MFEMCCVCCGRMQVTTYSHKDENNMWKVKPADRDVGTDEPVILVKNGDLIRLEHVAYVLLWLVCTVSECSSCVLCACECVNGVCVCVCVCTNHLE